MAVDRKPAVALDLISESIYCYIYIVIHINLHKKRGAKHSSALNLSNGKHEN